MLKSKKILLVASAVLIISLSLLVFFIYKSSTQHHFKVTFFDIGQGDSTLIQFSNGQKMLVDCGPDKKILAKLGRALPFYDRTLDYLLVTHPDLDHYGGCVDVLKNYKIKEIVKNGHQKYDSFYQVFDYAVRSENAINKIMDHHEVWEIASSTLEFFSPDPALDLKVSADDSNNYSIVFRLINNNKNFLFTADMEMPLEDALVKKYCPNSSTSPCPALESGILKVGHHGSDSSSGVEFLKLINPDKAIVSVGKNNRYGQPSLRVLKKLERTGAEILRTDQVGDIVEN